MKRTFAKLHFGFRPVSQVVPILALISTCIFSYGLCAPRIGWLSDDYNEVFGVSSAVPGWRAAFMMGGAGHWSPYRLLKYPLEGYLGCWLGPSYAHILQFTSHIICAILFYTLLKRVKWSTAASLAAGMLFCAFPWISQAVYWWAAATTIWATILALGAAHCLILWRESHSRAWLIAYASLVLLSLLLYELWLGGFIFFAGLDWYHQNTEKSDLAAVDRRFLQRNYDSSWRYGKIAVPFVVYGVLCWMAPSSEISDRIGLRLARLPALFALVHLRVAQWPLDTQWRWAFEYADTAFHSTFGALCFASEAAILLLLGYGWIRKCREGNLTQNSVPLWHSVLLGWAIFLGSRIALILQGYISRYDTRENYAASMGIAVVVIAVVSALIHSGDVNNWLRAAGGVMILAIVAVLGWTSAGIGVHYIMTSTAEAQTIRQLNRWLSASPYELSGLTIVVVAAPSSISHGTVELSYFNEQDGSLLGYAIRERCDRCSVFVTGEVECIDKRDTILLHDSADLTRSAPSRRWVLDERTALFRWTGQDLVPEPLSCP